jgi:carbon monoxide dehydrogenase subunit G
MDMTGERRIPAPRQTVWEALNDTAVLKASIPGCESLEKTDDSHMKATAAVKLGPISARFSGAVTLSDIDAPNSYTITGEGQGGVAGFAKGGAKVFLTDDDTNGPGATLLKYEVNAQVGGKLAQLGARLIDATAKQMAEQFFTKFSDEVQKLNPTEAPVTAPAQSPPVAIAAAETRPAPVAPPSAVSMLDLVPREPFGLPVIGWLGILAFVGMVVLWLASIIG